MSKFSRERIAEIVKKVKEETKGRAGAITKDLVKKVIEKTKEEIKEIPESVDKIRKHLQGNNNLIFGQDLTKDKRNKKTKNKLTN